MSTSDGARVVLDPTSERDPAIRKRVPRPSSLDGLTVGLLDISKARGDIFLDRLEELLCARGAAVKRFRKPTFTKPAPIDLRKQIATECGAVVEARALGADPAAVFVEHPIQDRTDEEMVAIAEGALEELLARLLKEG
jgi:hypothetical protein